MTESKSLLDLLNEKIEITEKMTNYYKTQLQNHEAVLDSLRELRIKYLKPEEEEEEKKGE